MILRNAVRCKLCGDVIESTYRHDFKWCKCGNCAVDGGKSYLKRCFKTSPDDLEELSVSLDVYRYNGNDLYEENNLSDIMPETNYQAAINVLNRWENDYTEVYKTFENQIGIPILTFREKLENYDIDAYKKGGKLNGKD